MQLELYVYQMFELGYWHPKYAIGIAMKFKVVLYTGHNMIFVFYASPYKDIFAHVVQYLLVWFHNLHYPSH